MKTANLHQTSRVVIEGCPPTLNQVIEAAKAHYGKYSSLKSKWTDRAELAVSEHGVKFQHTTFTIKCVWYWKDKRTDPDNVGSAVKFLLDGLVEAELLSGDGWKQVKHLEHVFRIDRDNPRVEIVITEV